MGSVIEFTLLVDRAGQLLRRRNERMVREGVI